MVRTSGDRDDIRCGIGNSSLPLIIGRKPCANFSVIPEHKLMPTAGGDCDRVCDMRRGHRLPANKCFWLRRWRKVLQNFGVFVIYPNTQLSFYTSEWNGRFEPIIIENIKARSHSVKSHCSRPGESSSKDQHGFAGRLGFGES